MATILFLHGWMSKPGGLKPSFLAQHGHEIITPALPDEDFEESVSIAQAAFARHKPDVVVGSSRGGSVAMNINSGNANLVLLCPAWKNWGSATKVKPGTVILHCRTDEIIPFADSEELVRNSGAKLITTGCDHRLADPDSLAAMLEAVEKATKGTVMIRPETPFDHAAIRDILVAAFANHPYSHQTEHLIVEGLRADAALTVSLVAELDGTIVGQIAFSPVMIDGKDYGWLALGPVAVAPRFQKQGIGKALVNEGLLRIRDLGTKGCVLVGEPAFYRRFGFENNPALRMEGIPSEFVMCLPMGDSVPEGNVTHHPAFHAGE